MPHAPIVTPFWDEPTGSWQYVVHEADTLAGVVIDPVWSFDPLSGATSTRPAQLILDFIEASGLRIDWVLDTHPHADHFSAAPWLAAKLGAKTGIGAEVVRVQRLWQEIYNLPDLACDGSQWDRLFVDGDALPIGRLTLSAMFTPGHTMASVTYLIGDAAFVADTLMMPDVGTSRCDFPGGSSAALHASLHRILALPDETRLYVGHDYAPERGALCMATVAEQKAGNIHLKDAPDEATFRQRRDARDATLPLPRLMLAALQVNIRGGRLPEPEANGCSYLKLPVGAFEARD